MYISKLIKKRTKKKHKNKTMMIFECLQIGNAGKKEVIMQSIMVDDRLKKDVFYEWTHSNASQTCHASAELTNRLLSEKCRTFQMISKCTQQNQKWWMNSNDVRVHRTPSGRSYHILWFRFLIQSPKIYTSCIQREQILLHTLHPYFLHDPIALDVMNF